MFSGGVGEVGECMRRLGLGFTNSEGTDEVIDVCLCLGWGGCSLACCWCPLKFPCVFLSHVFSPKNTWC